MSDNAPDSRWPHSLTAILPCHNEQDNVRRVTTDCAEALDRLVIDWEIIIVNDGSTDETGKLADELAAENERVHVIHHPRNLGYGIALQNAFARARGEYLFFTDGDGQFDVNQLDRLFPLTEQYDIVNGYRIDRKDNCIRRFNAWAWGVLVRRVLHFRCRDVDSAFKLFPRKMLDHFEMKSAGAMIDAELFSRATRAGFTTGEVGVDHRPRLAGKQEGAKLSIILRAFWELWRLRKDILATPPAKRN